jgi:hypothetical protein
MRREMVKAQRRYVRTFVGGSMLTSVRTPRTMKEMISTKRKEAHRTTFWKKTHLRWQMTEQSGSA